MTKRYLKGNLLGKGGFAKCFRVTDMDTNEDWACKIVQKSSLTKQRHKAKVRFLSIYRDANDCEDTIRNILRCSVMFRDVES